MNIRNRLTLLFIIIVGLIIVLASVAIYFFSADYREEGFYNRLRSKGRNTAKLLIDVDEVDVELLYRIERDNPASLPDEKIIVYDYRNQVIFSTDDDHEIQVDQNLLDQIRLNEEVRFPHKGHEVLGFLFAGRYDRFVVIVAATDIYGINKLQNLRTILLIVLAISLGLASLSGWFYAGRALRPISKVVNQVADISIINLDQRVDEGNGKDEIAQLARTFNEMLSRLEASFLLQKNFIANASHELRTPLTAITGQLEVNLLSARTNEEYRSVIESVLEDIRSLNKLFNKLLLLAQASAEDRERKMQHLRIDELLWQIKDELIKLSPTYQITIDLDENLDDDLKLTVTGDEQLVKVALSNIIENGCKYSADKATTVFVSHQDDRIRIQFKDNGIGIPDEDLPHIFEPFHRGRNTHHIKGHGIGLSMSEKIIKLHKGTIKVSSELNKGTVFTISFPTLHSF